MVLVRSWLLKFSDCALHGGQCLVVPSVGHIFMNLSWSLCMFSEHELEVFYMT